MMVDAMILLIDREDSHCVCGLGLSVEELKQSIATDIKPHLHTFRANMLILRAPLVPSRDAMGAAGAGKND